MMRRTIPIAVLVLALLAVSAYTQVGPGVNPIILVDSTGTPLGLNSSTLNTNIINPSIPVTGSFWQATQPVSISGSVPVTGTFWQATQPVSGPLTDAQLRATPVPVSGTFWQATQPVSGPLTDAQLRATAVPVSGTFWPATQPVSGTVTANAGSGTFAISGTVTANAGTGTLNVSCVSGCTAAQGQTYVAMVLGAASAASKDYINLTNATGSGKVLSILRVLAVVDSQVAVTGLQPGFTASRYTTAGSTCTSGSIAPVDTNNAAIPAQVTVTTTCTTDPTGLTNLGRWSLYADETQPSTNDIYLFRNNGGQPIVLREGQGLTLISGSTAPAGVVSLMIEFTM